MILMARWLFPGASRSCFIYWLRTHLLTAAVGQWRSSRCELWGWNRFKHQVARNKPCLWWDQKQFCCRREVSTLQRIELRCQGLGHCVRFASAICCYISASFILQYFAHVDTWIWHDLTTSRMRNNIYTVCWPSDSLSQTCVNLCTTEAKSTSEVLSFWNHALTKLLYRKRERARKTIP